jgi:large repetitive protein
VTKMKDMQALWLNSKLKKVVLLICFCGLGQQGFSQKLTTTNWYFGNSTNGIKFSRGTAKAEILTNKAIDFGTGGSAVATDPVTGNLLFYTDGNFVYDACGEEMADDLNANTAANQPVAICAVPDAKGQYYIFTNPVVGAISWSKVDMTKPGSAIFPNPPLGEVINPKNNPISGLTGKSEGMIVVSNANGKDFWLITHKKNSLDYTATRIDATGTFSPVLSTGIGTAPLSVANFSVSPVIDSDPAKRNIRKIAVAPQSANSNALILNFDTETGVITFDKSILNSGRNTANGQAIYDIEWTSVKTNPDNSKNQYLYLSYFGDVGIPADVLQYDYLNPTSTLTSVLPTTFRPSHSLGLQVGADSAIYYLYEPLADQFRVGRFTKTDTTASQVRFEQLPLGAINFGGTQFPAFLPDEKLLKRIDFTYSSTTASICQNTSVAFFPSVEPAADSLLWVFPNGTESKKWSPVQKLERSGNIKMIAFLAGQKEEVSKKIDIIPFNAQIKILKKERASDTTACRSEFPAPRNPNPPPPNKQFSITATVEGVTDYTATWSDPKATTGLTLRPDSAGVYLLTIRDNVSGCTASKGVNVKEYRSKDQDQRRNKWYFGNKAGIDFNKEPTPKALDDSGMTAPEGCAIVCDKNGETIFYTDGSNVYNRKHLLVENGENIGGSVNSSQSSLIVPVPDSLVTNFYIFTTTAMEDGSYEARYSVFDWKENFPLGKIVKKDVLLFTNSTERITVNGNWVIFHEAGNNFFRAYNVTSEGIGNPVFSSVGTNHSQCVNTGLDIGRGSMKISPQNILAVPVNAENRNFVELFNFNQSTGNITKFGKTDASNRIDLPENGGVIYGLEFSQGSNNNATLFITLNRGEASRFYAAAIDSVSTSILQNIDLPNAGAIETAPNGSIYVAIKGSQNLAEVTASNGAVNKDGFKLADKTTSALGLPNFRQDRTNQFGEVSLLASALCSNDSVRFIGKVTDSIDELDWTLISATSKKFFPFKDPKKDTVSIVVPADDYIVTLNVYNRCGLDTTVTKNVTVEGFEDIKLENNKSLCTGSVTLGELLPNKPGSTYSWSTGETTRTIVLSRPALAISVTLTSEKGCSSTATTAVAESPVAFELSPDQTVCQNVAVSPIKPFVFTTGYAYDWTITNESTGIVIRASGEEQPVDTSIPGVINYSVKITDPTNGCFDSNQVKFNVNVAPKFTLTKTDANCNTLNGEVDLSIEPSNPLGGPYSYSFTDQNAVYFSDVNVTPGSIPFNGLGGGTYSATVTDLLSGCATFEAIGVNAAAWGITATATNTCDPALVTVNVSSGSPSPGNLDFLFTGSDPSLPIPSVSNPTLVPSGSWTVQATDAAGCIATTSLTILPNPIQVAITTNLCATPATLIANAIGGVNPIYFWTDNDGIVDGSSSSIVKIDRGGTYEVTATVEGCSIKEKIKVEDFTSVTPTLENTPQCSDEVVVTVSPAGNDYTYFWSKDGTPQANLFGSRISLGLDDDGDYQVTVRDRTTGCRYLSDSKPINILGEISATLSSTPPCNDGKAFTLIATSTPTTGIKYTWSLNDRPIAGQEGKSISQTTDGKYQVTVTSNASPSCEAKVLVTIARKPIPEGKLPSAAIICVDPDNEDQATAKVELNPGSFLLYQWYKDNEFLRGETNQKLTVTSAGLYKVELTNSFNCTASDVTEVRNECIPRLVAPTAFSPGSKNAVNQNFFVYSFFITDEFEVTIFNRWGELMYESKDKNFKWNGTYNNQGQPLPPGMYAYSIKYVSSFRPEKGIQEQRGGVVLIR